MHECVRSNQASSNQERPNLRTLQRNFGKLNTVQLYLSKLRFSSEACDFVFRKFGDGSKLHENKFLFVSRDHERLQRYYYSKNPYMVNGKGSRYSILERQGSYFVKIKLEAVSVLLLTYCFTFYYLVSIQYNPIWNNVYNWRLKQMYRCLSSHVKLRINQNLLWAF